MGSTPSEETQHPQLQIKHEQFVEFSVRMTHTHTFTCRSVLQQLFELCWRQLCACDGHDHSNLCELHLDVGLLQITEECGGRDPLGGAVGRTLHHINNHLGPKKTEDT